jgi:hypothetical protein
MIVIMKAIAPNLPIAFPLPLQVIGSARCYDAQLSSGRRGELIPIRNYKVPFFMEAGFAMIALFRMYVRLSRSEATGLVQDDHSHSCGSDKRTQIVSLTRKGTKLIANAKPHWAAGQKTFLDLIGSGETQRSQAPLQQSNPGFLRLE